MVHDDDVSFQPPDEDAVFVFDDGYTPIDNIAEISVIAPLEQMRCL